MNEATRNRIVAAAEAEDFHVQLKDGHYDLYDKNLVFKSKYYGSLVFIHRVTGIDAGSGNPNYLKVAVHPDLFRADLIDPNIGIYDCLNARSKTNRHSSSNYVGFPVFAGNEEPCGKCYKIDLEALGSLLKGLRTATPRS
jgi:hypothetical protein